MSYFLLVVVTLLSNGQKTVQVEAFSDGSACYEAMRVVSQEAPNATVYCKEIHNKAVANE